MRKRPRIINVVVLMNGLKRPMRCIGCKHGKMVIRYRTIERFETVCCNKQVYPDAETLIRLLPTTE